MERLTRAKDKYECRVKDCPVDEWLMDHLPEGDYSLDTDPCENCPFVTIVNKLAEYEDKEEEGC